MRGLVFEGTRQLRWTDVPDPLPAAGEVILNVAACGICGSDVDGYLGITGRRTPPMIMGHEFVGVVTELGAGITRAKIGDRVAVQPLIYCGTCPVCRAGLTNQCPNRTMFGVLKVNGGMAERIAVPERALVPLPAEMADVTGSFLEPVAVAYHAVRRAQLEDARRVLVIGTGKIGLLLVQVLRRLHPRITILVSDLNSRRLRLAQELGGAEAFVPGGESVDVVFEVVGTSATVQQALAAVRSGGMCVWVGNSAPLIELNMQDAVTREVELHGSYSYTAADFGEALNLVANGAIQLQPLVSRVAPLAEGALWFKKLAQGDDNLIKVVLTNDNESITRTI